MLIPATSLAASADRDLGQANTHFINPRPDPPLHTQAITYAASFFTAQGSQRTAAAICRPLYALSKPFAERNSRQADTSGFDSASRLSGALNQHLSRSFHQYQGARGRITLVFEL